MSNRVGQGHLSDDVEVTENTANKGFEKEQPVVTPTIYYDHQKQLFLMPITFCNAKNSLSPSSESPESVVVKADAKIEAPSTISMTEKAFQPDGDPSISFVGFRSSAGGAEEDESPITETDLSEPKTGTTSASYGTSASSPTFPTQLQAASCFQQRGFSDVEEEILKMTDAEVVPVCSSINVAFLGKRSEGKDNFTLIEAQNPCENHIKMGREKEESPLWSNERAHSCLTASAPEFRPLSLTDADAGHVFQDVLSNELLVKAGATSVYNPLALEWCPSTRRESIGFDEGSQNQSNWPQLTVKVGGSMLFKTLEQINSAHTMKERNNSCHLDFSKQECDLMKEGWFETPDSMATTSGIVSGSQNRTIKEPRQGGSCATRPSIATLNHIQLHNKPTLAQRRAGRQLTNEQIRPSQFNPTIAKTSPASLLMTQESAKFNRAASVQHSAIPGSQQSQPELLPHKQRVTWKRLPKSDLDHVSIRPDFAEWLKIEQDLLRMGFIKRFPGKPDGGSFVVPKNYEQWLAFQAERTEDLILQKAAKIQRKNAEIEAATRARQMFSTENAHDSVFNSPKHTKHVGLGSAMNGKEYHDGRCTVLAQPSAWSRWYKPTEERPQALWPCIEEMKEEGDERHTSAFGRFMALPRVPGNPTVVWKVKPMIPALPFDEVWKVPNKDTWADLHTRSTEDIEETYMKAMVGQALLDAIDC